MPVILPEKDHNAWPSGEAGKEILAPYPADQRRRHRLQSRHDRTPFSPFSGWGSIEVKSERPDDNASKEAIRPHLKKVVGMFAQGDFSLPAGSIGQRAVCDPLEQCSAASRKFRLTGLCHDTVNATHFLPWPTAPVPSDNQTGAQAPSICTIVRTVCLDRIVHDGNDCLRSGFRQRAFCPDLSFVNTGMARLKFQKALSIFILDL
jgi:hypothetical protein